MTAGPLELWADQLRRTKEYEARRALIPKQTALGKRLGEVDVVPKSTETDGAFIAQFDDRARRLAELLFYFETQIAIAEARHVKPKRSFEEPKC